MIVVIVNEQLPPHFLPYAHDNIPFPPIFPLFLTHKSSYFSSFSSFSLLGHRSSLPRPTNLSSNLLLLSSSSSSFSSSSYNTTIANVMTCNATATFIDVIRAQQNNDLQRIEAEQMMRGEKAYMNGKGA